MLYSNEVWKDILKKDDEFKKLWQDGYAFVSNFYYGDGVLCLSEFSQAANNLIKAGFRVEISRAYDINGELMPDFNSLWRHKLSGKRITDKKKLEEAVSLRSELYEKLPPAERLSVLKKLVKIFGLKGAVGAKEALRDIATHLSVSHYFLRIKEANLKPGAKVFYQGTERPGVIEKIMWDGRVVIRFDEGSKGPKSQSVSPYLIRVNHYLVQRLSKERKNEKK